jgi:hypothetical protein
MKRTTLFVIAYALAVVGAAWHAHAGAAATRREAVAGPAAFVFPPIPAPTRKLDEYGDIRWEDEKARLDNFAIELEVSLTARGYLTCYGGRVGRDGEAQRRCRRAKRYVSGYRHIDASRIMTVDGGFRETLIVELWVVHPGVTPPAPSPTVDRGEVRFIKSKSKKRARRR